VNRGSGGGAPSWVQGQSPWSGGQGAKPTKAESFSVAGYPMKWKIYYSFLILRLIHYLAKCEKLHIYNNAVVKSHFYTFRDVMTAR